MRVSYKICCRYIIFINIPDSLPVGATHAGRHICEEIVYESADSYRKLRYFSFMLIYSFTFRMIRK